MGVRKKIIENILRGGVSYLYAFGVYIGVVDHPESYKQKIVERYLANTATKEELAVFVHLLNEGLLDQYLLDGTLEEFPLTEQGTLRPISPFRRLKKYWAAAAVLVLLATGAGLWIKFAHSGTKTLDIAVLKNDFKNDVKPGGLHAVLTLASGAQIVLDSAGTEKQIEQGNVLVSRVVAGKLAYQTHGNKDTAVYYNTLTTPAGGQYQVVLADGTRVWLNAESSLKFPTTFTGGGRSVELTGEAYFEVAETKDKPFNVTVNGMAIRVLGTKFNVNAYMDEPGTKASLLEGAIKLIRANNTLLLKPGEQGFAPAANGLDKVKDGDVEQAVAWKKGSFSFEDADIRMVMRQLSRWYGIKVVYKGEPTQALFGGRMQRNLNLTQILNGLSKSEVHFHLEGRLLTVLP